MIHRIQVRLGGPKGFSVLELLVVIGIMGVLFSLVLPAVQSAREAAARATCMNHLRQMGLAMTMHHDTNHVFPSNGGWDVDAKIKATDGSSIYVYTKDASGPTFKWGVGKPGQTPQQQPGSWAYAILPYIEQDNVFVQRTWGTPLALYVCPSRRSAEATVPVNDQFGEYEGGGWAWGHIDYASNGRVVPNRPRCLRVGEITDGTSNTILIGEKAMSTVSYMTGTWYWDEPYFLGGSGGTQRGIGFSPVDGNLIIQDSAITGMTFRYNWGAAHHAGAHFLFCDGSVRIIQFGLTSDLVLSLLTPAGGERIPEY